MAKNQNKIIFSSFKHWIENNQILIGFNLTEKLLQRFFSYLDPHKKGFLTAQDWINIFGNLKIT